MALPRPSMSSVRPAYLESMFQDSTPPLPPLPVHPAHRRPKLHASKSSLTLSSFGSSKAWDMRMPQTKGRQSPPPPVQITHDENETSRLRKLSPRFKVRDVFNRNTYPQVAETTGSMFVGAPAPKSPPRLRRPSLPRLITTQSEPSTRRGSTSHGEKGLPVEKALPATPVQAAQELSCDRCYYFAARHCNGFVLGGSAGDACEQCLVRAGHM